LFLVFLISFPSFFIFFFHVIPPVEQHDSGFLSFFFSFFPSFSTQFLMSPKRQQLFFAPAWVGGFSFLFFPLYSVLISFLMEGKP